MDMEREAGFGGASLYWREFKLGRMRWIPIFLSVNVKKTIMSMLRWWFRAKGNWKYC